MRTTRRSFQQNFRTRAQIGLEFPHFFRQHLFLESRAYQQRRTHGERSRGDNQDLREHAAAMERYGRGCLRPLKRGAANFAAAP